MALSADILRGYMDAIILCQLAQGDSYGYQINKDIMKKTGNRYELKGFGQELSIRLLIFAKAILAPLYHLVLYRIAGILQDSCCRHKTVSCHLFHQYE